MNEFVRKCITATVTEWSRILSGGDTSNALLCNMLEIRSYVLQMVVV